MVKIKHGFAAIAAFGLAVSPAMAETRSAQALPAPSAIVDSNAVSLASQPTQNADSLGGRFSILLLLALLASIAAIILVSTGGGKDSPG
jgi:hypothetical protein